MQLACSEAVTTSGRGSNYSLTDSARVDLKTPNQRGLKTD